MGCAHCPRRPAGGRRRALGGEAGPGPKGPLGRLGCASRVRARTSRSAPRLRRPECQGAPPRDHVPAPWRRDPSGAPRPPRRARSPGGRRGPVRRPRERPPGGPPHEAQPRASPLEEGKRHPCPARMRAASRVWTCSLHHCPPESWKVHAAPGSGAGKGVLVSGTGTGEVPALPATGETRPARPQRRRRAEVPTRRSAREWSRGSWAGGQLRAPDAAPSPHPPPTFPRHKR